MATKVQEKCRAYGTISGNSPRIMYYHERQGETFKKGALLYLNASGYARIAVIANGKGTGFDQIRKRLIGIAGKNASNLTTTAEVQASSLPVFANCSDTIFIANVKSLTSAAASSLSYADEGKALTGTLNSSMFYPELAGSAASSILKITQFIDSKGDVYGRVLFQFLDATRILP